jgi:hypothetical protein
MNDNTQKLLDALRSGEYEQGRNQLRVEHSDGSFAHCCLGVACDISGAGEWHGESRYVIGDIGDFDADMSSTRLPRAVAEWLGWNNRDGMWDYSVGAIDLNDTGVQFAEIADAIEANFDALTTYGSLDS